MRRRKQSESYGRYFDPMDKRWYPTYYYDHQPSKPYSGLDFLGDLLMLTLTGGLWFIWIFVREMRRRNVRNY